MAKMTFWGRLKWFDQKEGVGGDASPIALPLNPPMLRQLNKQCTQLIIISSHNPFEVKTFFIETNSFVTVVYNGQMVPDK